ncbi:MAG: hypothetical protein JSS14_22745 [Proteobacteria bacterium]|nr:hypothetical protein [Pseudomonadota bacterium]
MNALAGAALLALAACGGGSSDSGGAGAGPGGSPDAGTPAADNRPTTKVIDGPISGAIVFLDRNDNGLLDDGEPSAVTDAAGIAHWSIGVDELGSAPLVARIGTDATDADHGSVTRAFTLSSPAGSTSVVSPLTTLVHRVVQQTGVTVNQAEAALKSRTGIGALLADYSADTSAAGREAALSGRLAVLQLQQQSERLASHIGSPDAGGSTISAADIDQAALDSVVRNVPSLAQAARDGGLQGTCANIGSSECGAALQTLAIQGMDASGLAASTLPTHAAAWRTFAQGTVGEAGFSLTDLIYTDANNWYWRVLMSSEEDAVPGADGRTRYRQLRRASTNGTVVEWGDGPTYARRDDTHWNGANWQTCPETEMMPQGARDAQGLAVDTDFCNGRQRVSNRRWSLNIAGKDMLQVAAAMREALPNTTSNWGATSTLQGAAFPTGARLYAQATTSTATAPVYLPTSTVRLYSAELSRGGDVRSDPANACSSPEAAAAPTIEASSLEMMIERLQGQPCISPQQFLTSSASSTPVAGPNTSEWWGNSTANIGQLGNAPVVSNPTSFFTGNTLVTVAFDPAKGVAKYFICQQRQVTSSTRSCTLAGTGSYSIETLGDGRVLRLAGVPAVAAFLDYERIYVERGGKVYAGYQSKPSHSTAFRLNVEATNALFTQLGVATITP